MKYKKICQAIMKKKDWKKVMVEWMMLFESTRVVGFNRDEFMDCMIVCKKEAKKWKK